MLRFEVVDGGTNAMRRRLEENGFDLDESLTYIGRTSLDYGQEVEVWVKDDGEQSVKYIDIEDLPDQVYPDLEGE